MPPKALNPVGMVPDVNQVPSGKPGIPPGTTPDEGEVGVEDGVTVVVGGAAVGEVGQSLE